MCLVVVDGQESRSQAYFEGWSDHFGDWRDFWIWRTSWQREQARIVKPDWRDDLLSKQEELRSRHSCRRKELMVGRAAEGRASC